MVFLEGKNQEVVGGDDWGGGERKKQVREKRREPWGI